LPPISARLFRSAVQKTRAASADEDGLRVKRRGAAWDENFLAGPIAR
jgi:hypothetical protein